MGSDIYGVNAEYSWRDHSWYAILSFLFFFLAPLLSPLTPILSLPPFPLHPSCSWLILTLCRAAHLLQVDFVVMHGKCTAWYLGGVPHVRDMCDEPYAGPACKTFFKMDQSWCCSCVLVCHPRLSPPLPLLFLSFLLLIILLHSFLSPL